MFKVINFFLLVFILSSCGKPEVEPILENEDYYNCDDFFIEGDYSNVCNIDTTIPEITSETLDGGGTVCKYIFPALDDTQIESGVSFISLEKSAQAEQAFESQRMQSETLAAEDSLRFHEEMKIGGLDGYVAEGQYANYSKSASVRYKNVLVTAAVIYYKNWYPDTPCNYETDELTALLAELIKNM